ncbi:hypothetical protein ACFO0N_11910 [Halobium salinum]|uniref:Pilin/flagellin n=1 Tax=Halobium salinum TaxID=1364940 RepID=A0ABD5PDB8_9EURY|nr:hypothetical protein [Halobium salinum]
MAEFSLASLLADRRALSPVVGKTMEVALVTVFVTLLVSTLYGGAVPAYRTAAADEVGDRTLATAAERVETAIPPNATGVDSETRVDLPRTIRGAQYRLRANGSTLALDHPDDRLDGRVRLSLPDAVVAVNGEWESDDPAVVRVDDTAGGLAVEIGSSDAASSTDGEPGAVTR